MKRTLLLPLAVLMVMAFAASRASAVNLPQGPLAGSIIDQSGLWRDGEMTEPGSTPSVDDEQRTVFYWNALDLGTLTNTPTGPQVTGTSGVDSFESGSLVGMMYDLAIIHTTAASPFDNLYFGPGGRYASDGSGTDGTWADMYTPDGNAATTAGGFGGLVIVWQATPGSYNADGDDGTAGNGPSQWSEGTGAGASDGSVDTFDEFPTVSVGEPWLVGVFAPLAYTVLPAGAEDTLVYERGSDSGWIGRGFINVIGGTYASQIVPNVFGDMLDVRIDFTSYVPLDGQSNPTTTTEGWQVNSLDPVQLAVLPEPATMSLLGISLLALAGVGRKRK